MFLLGLATFERVPKRLQESHKQLCKRLGSVFKRHRLPIILIPEKELHFAEFGSRCSQTHHRSEVSFPFNSYSNRIAPNIEDQSLCSRVFELQFAKQLVPETMCSQKKTPVVNGCIVAIFMILQDAAEQRYFWQQQETEMAMPESIKISLEPEEQHQLQRIANGRRIERRLAERAQIVLDAAGGLNHSESARKWRVQRKTIRKWRRRYLQRREEKPEASVAEYLVDAKRTGRPFTFDAFFWVDVLIIATSDPKESGRPMSEWTHRELQDEVIKQGLAPSIHSTTITRFLKECDLQPHRVKEWMNRPDDLEFEPRAKVVKTLCHAAVTEELEEGEVVVSFDEKTGMQAKERIVEDQLMLPGQPKRIEFEYKRHGTLVLFALMVVNSGMIKGVTRPNRTNEVTAEVLGFLLGELLNEGHKKIHVILDQLNTHWSVALVATVATLCNLPIPTKEETKTGSQRKTWLSSGNKAIVFHYTPKHASWLNPVERWLGVLVKKLLRYGSFPSTEDLAQQVAVFIEYYNAKMAHPYRFKRWREAA